MIRNDVFDIINIFKKNNDLQMVNIVTNGWFIKKIKDLANEVLDKIPDLSINFGISIDGLEEKHDFIRQKKGSFQKCCETLEELKKITETREKNKLTFNVNGVYTAMNADSISETADFFIKNLKVPYTICLVRGEDIQNNDYKKVDVDHYYKTYKKIMKDNEIQPINVVVYHGSIGRTSFEVSFPLRCFQQLSRPYLATRHCSWRYNRSTSGTSIPVLSY